MAVYVDDLIIARKTPEEMQEVKQLLSLQFQMKDMGELHYCMSGNHYQARQSREIDSSTPEAVSPEDAENVQARGCQTCVYTS